MPDLSPRSLRRRLTLRYVLALTAVAVLVLAGQVLVQLSLHDQAADGREVNLAGRQRMLSQRIAKHALAAVSGMDRDRHLAALDTDVQEWQRVHRDLLRGSDALGLLGLASAPIYASLDSLSGTVEDAGAAAQTLRTAVLRDDDEAAQQALAALLSAEQTFLTAMDRVVFALDADSRSAVAWLRWVEGAMLLVTLLVLFFEARFVFRPAVRWTAESVAKLAEQRELLRTIFNHAPDPIFAIDREERYVMSSHAHAHILGFEDPEQVLGLTVFDIMPAEVAEAISEADRSVMETGEPTLGNELEVSLQGQSRWVVVSCVPLRDDTDAVVGLVGIVRDITEAKQREQEIAEKEALLRTIIDAVPDPIFAKDREGRCIARNLADAHLIGYDSVEPTLGLTVFDAVPEPVAERLWEADLQVMERGEPQIDRETHLAFDGNDRWVLSSKIPLRGEDGEVVGMVGVMRDITEQKQAEVRLREAKEKAEQATRAKSEFLATMSHEIRTPMNGVIGMTSLLLDTDLDAEQQDFVETIRTSGDALLTLINDILDFSKVEAGHLDLEIHPFDLRTVVEEALDLAAPKAAEKGIALAYLIEDGTPGAVEGDAARLRQVLVNLVGNAVKFTAEGSVFVRVAAVPLDPDAGTRCVLHVAVEDTGIGIAEDKLEQVFESFSQADASTTRQHGGTGLGLTISRRLVELMGGRIGVESELGVGSTFRFSVNVAAAASTKRVFLRAEPPELSGRRVLIVDDNAVNRRILGRFAERWGMPAAVAGSGAEALRLASEAADRGQPFEVVLLDMQMPEMDGLAVAEALARTAPRPVVVMLTSIHRDSALAQEGTLDAVLYKPIKPGRLYDTLIGVFEQSEAPAATLAVPEAAPVEAEAAGAEEPSSLRILLAEDNVVNQKVALRMLERLGYRADVAANGAEALAALRLHCEAGQPYEVVLMDVQMPEMDGLEATRRVRAELRHQPYIVALTANAMQGDRERCLNAGADDYLAKPVDVQALRQALEQRTVEVPDASEAAPAVSSAEVSKVRAAVAAQIGDDDPEFVREITSSYLESTESLLNLARASLYANDIAAAVRAAHTLKSSSAQLGFEDLAEQSATLEEDIQNARLAEAASGLRTVEDEFARVRPLVQALLRELPGAEGDTDGPPPGGAHFPNWITKPS
ncbi:MAG: response regulator [Bacteroidota bacterium]